MKNPHIEAKRLNEFISQSLKEDLGEGSDAGDHSSLAIFSNAGPGKGSKSATANLLIKEDMVLAGVALATYIFRYLDAGLTCTVFKKDGEEVKKGVIALEVKGPVLPLLTAERLVLNCMQRMSGIASYTRQLQGMIAHTKAVLLDTRKTTPNFRMLEKWAVQIGGGKNHRFGLYDMIMLKDNHVDFAGGVKPAIRAARAYLDKTKLALPIEIETRNLTEVKAVLEEGGVDYIMLDNMYPSQMKEAVDMIAGRYKVEASGGIREDSIVAVAESGVDYISVGALTHSAGCKDMSLKAKI